MKIGVGIGVPFSGKAGIPPVDSPPVNVTLPSIPLVAIVGRSMPCDPGVWNGYPPPGFSYQWKKDNVNIAGATSQVYIVQAGDVGGVLKCTVTATNSQPPIAVADSNNSQPVAAQVGPPTNMVAPAITGATVPGNTLTCSQGTWSATPAITGYTYQWYVNGSAAGTGNTHLIASDEAGASIYCTVTATNGQGSTPANSNTVVVSSTASRAEELLLPYVNGVAGSFLTSGLANENWLGSMEIKDTITPANNFLTDTNKLITDKFTFAGNSLRMVKDGDGLIKYGNHNLYARSNLFSDAVWNKSRCTVLQNLPDYSGAANKAWRFTEDTSLNTHNMGTSNKARPPGAIVEASIDVHVGSPDRGIYIAIDDASFAGGTYITFDPNTGDWSNANGSYGVGVSRISRTYTDIGNGWWRVVLQADVSSYASVNAYFRIFSPTAGTTNYQGDGVSYVGIARAHLRFLPCQAVSYYIETGANPVYMPRIAHKNGQRLGMLGEPQSTNKTLNSRNFSAGGWNSSALDIVPNAAIGVDGQMSASRIVPTTANSNHMLYAACGTEAAAKDVMWWCLKAEGYRKVHLRAIGDGDGNYVLFDLIDHSMQVIGTPDASLTYGMYVLNDGWCIPYVAGKNPATAQNYALMSIHDDNGDRSFSGDGIKGVLCCQAQYEPNLVYPTSPIITGDSEVTRLSDNMNLLNNNFNMTATELAQYAKVFLYSYTPLAYNTPDPMSVYPASGRLHFNTGKPDYWGGPTNFSYTHSFVVGQTNKVAVSGNASRKAISMNGHPVVVLNEPIIAATSVDGMGLFGGTPVNFPIVIEEFMFLKQNLEDSALEDLTTL